MGHLPGGLAGPVAVGVHTGSPRNQASLSVLFLLFSFFFSGSFFMVLSFGAFFMVLSLRCVISKWSSHDAEMIYWEKTKETKKIKKRKKEFALFQEGATVKTAGRPPK